MKVFLGFSYDDRNTELADQFRDLLTSHGLDVYTGADVGGEELTDAIKKIIDGCDALVALLTLRTGDGPNATHTWVRDELNYMRNTNKRPTIAIVEEGVKVQGMGTEAERIRFDEKNPVPALLKLSRTAAIWKRAFGRDIKIEVSPPALIPNLMPREKCTCQYRFQWQGEESEWKDCNLIPEGNSAFFYIRRAPHGDTMIQIKITREQKSFQSSYTPLWTPVTFA